MTNLRYLKALARATKEIKHRNEVYKEVNEDLQQAESMIKIIGQKNGEEFAKKLELKIEEIREKIN